MGTRHRCPRDRGDRRHAEGHHHTDAHEQAAREACGAGRPHRRLLRLARRHVTCQKASYTPTGNSYRARMLPWNGGHCASGAPRAPNGLTMLMGWPVVGFTRLRVFTTSLLFQAAEAETVRRSVARATSEVSRP